MEADLRGVQRNEAGRKNIYPSLTFLGKSVGKKMVKKRETGTIPKGA